jgi:hypothetical protein
VVEHQSTDMAQGTSIPFSRPCAARDVVLDRPSDGFRGLGDGRALLPEAEQYLGVGALMESAR